MFKPQFQQIICTQTLSLQIICTNLKSTASLYTSYSVDYLYKPQVCGLSLSRLMTFRPLLCRSHCHLVDKTSCLGLFHLQISNHIKHTRTTIHKSKYQYTVNKATRKFIYLYLYSCLIFCFITSVFFLFVALCQYSHGKNKTACLFQKKSGLMKFLNLTDIFFFNV